MLVAGTKYRGEYEERLKKLTEEITSSMQVSKDTPWLILWTFLL
uniref:Uncharacterized protein n=1 Tax=Physcomitrium patens TaxID=3218 RepID=A0A7I3Z5M4_PHYPA